MKAIDFSLEKASMCIYKNVCTQFMGFPVLKLMDGQLTQLLSGCNNE